MLPEDVRGDVDRTGLVEVETRDITVQKEISSNEGESAFEPHMKKQDQAALPTTSDH